MLITPALLHVKTRVGSGRQEPANRPPLEGSRAVHPVEGLSAWDILSRLDVPVMQEGPEATEWRCIRADHAAMAEAGEWEDLLEAMRFADQENRMASGGCRVATLISEGALGRLRGAVTAGDPDQAGAELRRFMAVQALHANDYCAAHLLAEAHLALGGPGHLTAAEEIISDFDPVEELSPLLAASRYRLLLGLDGGQDFSRDWYEDWCDLDPGDARPHATHAAYLVQQAGVSAAGFEKVARRAAGMTEDSTGKAAYAVFHMTAHALRGAVWPTVDADLLARGLLDYSSATGCQHRANQAASFLARVLAEGHSEAPMLSDLSARLREALSDLVRNRLQEIHLESWTDGADCLAFAFGEVFGTALAQGGRIQRAGGGLGARIPRNASPLAPNRRPA